MEKENKDIIKTMELGDVIDWNSHKVERVPTGWLFDNKIFIPDELYVRAMIFNGDRAAEISSFL